MMLTKKISTHKLEITSFVVFFIFLSYITLHTSGDTFDEFVFLEGAKRILTGQVLYKDFFSFLPPGLYYLVALVWKIFGTQYIYIRLLSILINFSICLFIYLIYKKFINKRLALLNVWLFIIVFLPTELNIYHHWLALLFILIETLFFLKYLEKQKNKYLVYAGLALGFGCLFLHTTVGYIFIATLLWLIFYKKNILAALYFGIFFLLPIISVIAYFVSQAGWTTIWQNLIISNLSYYPRINYLPLYKNFLFFADLVSLVIISALLIKNNDLKNPALLWLYIITLIMFGSSLYRLDLTHQAYVYPAFTLLFVNYVSPYISRYLNIKSLNIIWLIFLMSPLITSLCASHILAYTNRDAWEKISPTTIGDVYLTRNRALATKTILATIKKLPSNKILIYPNLPLYYSILDIQNPSRFTLLENDYMSETDKNILKNDLLENKIEYVLQNPIERRTTISSPLDSVWLKENFPHLETLNYPGTNKYFFLYSKK